MIRNLIWDADSALFDTRPAMTYAISRSLNEMGHTLALNVIDGLVRQSLKSCFQTISQRFKVDPDLLLRQVAEAYLNVSPEKQPAYPGVKAVCTWIQTQGGQNLALVHEILPNFQDLAVAHGLASFFDGVYGADDETFAKSAGLFLDGLLHLRSLAPSETLLVSGHPVWLQAGRAAGTFTCFYCPVDILRQIDQSNPVDLLIDDYQQLVERLSGNRL